MRERLRSDMNIRENSNHPEDLPQIRISMGTCGIAAGAKEVMSRFISELRARNVDAVVTQTDCMGHCEAEPTVEITLPGREPVLYGDVTPDRVAAIIDKYYSTHDLNNLFVCLAHSFLAEPADILDRLLHTLCDNPVASVELLPADIHVISEDSRIN